MAFYLEESIPSFFSSFTILFLYSFFCLIFLVLLFLLRHWKLLYLGFSVMDWICLDIIGSLLYPLSFLYLLCNLDTRFLLRCVLHLSNYTSTFDLDFFWPDNRFAFDTWDLLTKMSKTMLILFEISLS